MKKVLIKVASTAGLRLPAFVFAPTGSGAGHDHGGLASGLLHPFTGIDPLAAMLGSPFPIRLA